MTESTHMLNIGSMTSAGCCFSLVVRRFGPFPHERFPLGNLVFFLTGAPSEKMAFAKEGAKITRLTVADPNVMLMARRE